MLCIFTEGFLQTFPMRPRDDDIIIDPIRHFCTSGCTRMSLWRYNVLLTFQKIIEDCVLLCGVSPSPSLMALNASKQGILPELYRAILPHLLLILCMISMVAYSRWVDLHCSIVFGGMEGLKPMETPLDTIISLVSYINKAGEKFFNFTPSHHRILTKLATIELKTSSLNF